MKRRRLLTGGAALASTGLTGCFGGSGGSDADDGDGGSTPDTSVTISGSSYDPLVVEVDTGATVEWSNEDSYGHDVTSAQFTDAATSWTLAASVDAGGSVTHTFDAEGVYEYYCTIHGDSTMCGAVLVGGAAIEGRLPCQTDDGDGGVY